MTRQPNSNDEHHQELIDSLLQAMYETSCPKAQSLVSSGLPRLDDDTVRFDLKMDSPQSTPSRQQLSRPVIIALATAALILIVVSLSLFDQSGTAIAAVQKSLDQALVDVGRHYRVKSQVRLEGNKKIIYHSDLYVQGGDQFAWRLNTPIVQNGLWFGSDRGQAWVVPPVGPVIEGGNQSLVDWAAGRQFISSPYLHISLVLQRMSDEYELQFKATTSPEDPSGLTNCQHVVGMLKGPRTNLSPDEVELWADSETGVAKLVVQRWKLRDKGVGWGLIRTELVEETVLPDDFFTANAHGGRNRTRISFNAGVIQ